MSDVLKDLSAAIREKEFRFWSLPGLGTTRLVMLDELLRIAGRTPVLDQVKFDVDSTTLLLMTIHLVHPC